MGTPDDEAVVTEEQEEGFDEAFGPEPKETEETSEEETEEETEEEEEESEETPEEEETEEETEEEPEDEVTARGKELLEEENRRKEEEKQRQEEEERQAKEREQQETQRRVASEPVTPQLARTLATILTAEHLPNEDIEVNGVSMNLKQYAEENPEALTIASVAFRNGMNRLLQGGHIMTKEAVQQQVSEALSGFRQESFDEAIQGAHSDAVKIVGSEEFATWLSKEATDEEKALFRSKKAADHILGLTRFKNRDKIKEARKNRDEKQKEAEEKKGKHKDLHKHSGKSTPKVPKGGGKPDDFDSAFEEAAKEAEKGKI